MTLNVMHFEIINPLERHLDCNCDDFDVTQYIPVTSMEYNVSIHFFNRAYAETWHAHLAAWQLHLND